MTNEDAWLLLKHILSYTNDNNPEPPNTVVDLVFEPIKQQLKRDLVEYETKCQKNKENIDKRWNKENTTVYDGIPPSTKHTDKDIDNDTDTDIEINYNPDILELVEKFTSIKENAYNETHATIKKIGRKKYIDNQYKTVEKLIRAWHTLEQIEDVAVFCTKDEFRKWNVKSLCKLDQANKEWVKYINVLLDKIK